MVESRDYGRVAGPSLWRGENLFPLMAITLLSAMVGGVAVAAWYVFAGDSGDEPPIRVKNGSMEFLVLGNDKWKRKDEHWVMKGEKDRYQELIHLNLVYGEGAPVCPTTVSSDVVHFIFSDDTTVTVHAAGKRTQVKAAVPGRLNWGTDGTGNENKKNLVYSGAGHIKSIKLGETDPKDGTPFCDFTNPNQLTHVLLLDYQ